MTTLDDVARRVRAQRRASAGLVSWCVSPACVTSDRSRFIDATREIRRAEDERSMARENKMKVEAWRTRRAEKEARTRETAEKEARRAAAVRRSVFEEGREAREARARARANERAERAEKEARATTSGRSNEAMLTYFRARDAMDVRRRTEEIERARGEEERLARELRLRAATSRKAPVVPRSVERAASATEAWLRRRAATMDDHFRVMEDDLDVFERANRLGWILNAREHRRATPRWRTIEPGVALREY